jgi:hypothetical protein
MPTISFFYGILIQMFWNDHGQPHFHALYGENEAVIAIETLDVLRGSLPRRAMTLVLDWAAEHQDELRRNWELCRLHRMPAKIDPLT